MRTGCHLQDCLSFGKPLLIENIEEELDPVLDPVLERRYVKKGRGFTVALADKEVHELTAFSLYASCFTLWQWENRTLLQHEVLLPKHVSGPQLQALSGRALPY